MFICYFFHKFFEISVWSWFQPLQRINTVYFTNSQDNSFIKRRHFCLPGLTIWGKFSYKGAKFRKFWAPLKITCPTAKRLMKPPVVLFLGRQNEISVFNYKFVSFQLVFISVFFQEPPRKPDIIFSLQVVLVTF